MGAFQYPFTSARLTPDLIETLEGHPKQIYELLGKTIEVTGIKFAPRPQPVRVKHSISFEGDVPTEPFIAEIPFPVGYSLHNGQPILWHELIPCIVNGERGMPTFENQSTSRGPSRESLSSIKGQSTSRGSSSSIEDQSTSRGALSRPACNEKIAESSTVATRSNKQPLNPILEAMVYRNCLLVFEMLEDEIKKRLSTIQDLSPQSLNQLKGLKRTFKTFINALDQYQESINKDQIDDDIQTEMLKAKNKCLLTYKKLQGSKIKEYLNPSLDITIDHVICSILGLGFLVSQDLNSLDPNIRCHQTDLFWIHKFMDNAWEDLQDELSAIPSFVVLQKLGFNERKAEFLAKRIEESEVSDHQTILAWAKEYIDHKFKYDILLNHEVPNYPYNDNLVDTSYNISVDQEDDDDEDNEQTNLPVEVNGINVGLSEIENFLEKYREKSKNSEDHKYWFHGTDHKSAQNIIENGIDLEKGKNEADFSSGNGFYLASSIDFAFKWSTQMMKKATCAILVFEIDNPKEFFNGFQGTIYQEPNKDWSDTVRYYRNGKDLKYLSKFRPSGYKRFAESLRKQNFIIGPISKDGSNAKQDGWTPRPRQDNSPFEMELCIKEFFMAEEFYKNGRNLHQAIFASKKYSSKQMQKMRR